MGDLDQFIDSKPKAKLKSPEEISSTGGRRLIPQLKDRQRQQILPYSVFCSIPASNGLDEAHPHWGGQSALLSLPISVLISSRNILMDPPKMFNQISGHPVA